MGEPFSRLAAAVANERGARECAPSTTMGIVAAPGMCKACTVAPKRATVVRGKRRECGTPAPFEVTVRFLTHSDLISGPEKSNSNHVNK